LRHGIAWLDPTTFTLKTTLRVSDLAHPRMRARSALVHRRSPPREVRHGPHQRIFDLVPRLGRPVQPATPKLRAGEEHAGDLGYTDRAHRLTANQSNHFEFIM
jgi:hypothetical protein